MTPQEDSPAWLVLKARPGLADRPDAIKRRDLPLDQMPMLDDVLAAAHGYWSSKLRPSRLPSRGDIDILDIVNLIKHLHLIDISDSDPDQWYFRIIGAIVPKSFGWGIGREKISDCPWPVYRQALWEDFGTVKATATPLYQEIALRVERRVYQYARLLLPLAADGCQVDTLMSCVVLRPTPDLDV